MELNEMFLNIIPNGWSKKAYVQGFYCDTLHLKSVNMFEHVELMRTFMKL